MGREIAKCLRGPARAGDGFIETAEGVVTWCFGHILRQAEPEEYDAAYKKWTESVLPIVPTTWKLIVSESSVKQFGIVKGLIAKADEIVHAGDPDREFPGAQSGSGGRGPLRRFRREHQVLEHRRGHPADPGIVSVPAEILRQGRHARRHQGLTARTGRKARDRSRPVPQGLSGAVQKPPHLVY